MWAPRRLCGTHLCVTLRSSLASSHCSPWGECATSTADVRAVLTPECHFAGRARCETLRSSLASSHSLQPVGGMSVASTADVRAVLVPLCRAQRWNAAGCYEPSLTCWWRPGCWRLARCRRRFLNTARGAAAPAGCASLCWCCRSGSSHRERGCRCGRHRRWRRRAQQRKSRSGRRGRHQFERR